MKKGDIIKNFELDEPILTIDDFVFCLKNTKSFFWKFKVMPTSFFWSWTLKSILKGIQDGDFWTIQEIIKLKNS